MSDPSKALEGASPSVVEVIRELRQSGLNNLEDLIRQGIEASQFTARGKGAVVEGQTTTSLRSEWTFISPDYVYTGGGGGTRLW